MSGELLDLDAVARPDKTVELEQAGRKVRYRLPGDPPSGLVVRMDVLNRELTRAQDDKDAEAAQELSEQLREIVLELFQLRQPDLDMGFIDSLSYDQLGAVFYFTLGLYQQVEPDPPKPQGSRTPSRRNSPRSGSSASARASRS